MSARIVSVPAIDGFLLRAMADDALLGVVYRTNRTKRDVIMEDTKLPYIGDALSAS